MIKHHRNFEEKCKFLTQKRENSEITRKVKKTVILMEKNFQNNCKFQEVSEFQSVLKVQQILTKILIPAHFKGNFNVFV